MKMKSGFTLLELIIAMAVLAIASTALLVMFTGGLQESTRSHVFTMASIEAQMQMEQIVGRRWVDDLEHLDWLNEFDSNGFTIRLEYCNNLGGNSLFRNDNPNDPILLDVTVVVITGHRLIPEVRHRNILIVSNSIV